MDEYSDIVEFSRDLYFHHTEIPVSEKDQGKPKPPRVVQAVESTMGYLCDAFCTQLYRVYDNHLSQVRSTDEQFMSYVIPRCLKLVDCNMYYLSFMLVAAFIGELAYHLENDRHCFRFTGSAYKCLAAVFKRRFRDAFEEKGGWQGLRAYCDDINRAALAGDVHISLIGVVTRFDRACEKRVLDLIKQCDVVEDECFALNEYELSLIAADDNVAIEAELSNSIPSSGDFLLQMENTILKDTSVVSLSSPFDSMKGTVLSKCIWETTILNIEPPVVQIAEGKGDDFLSETDETFESDSCDESESDSELELSDTSEVPDLEDMVTGEFGLDITYLLQPKDYDQELSAHMCKWCDERCFRLKKYFFRRHRDLSLK